MRQAFSISALAKSAGVTTKTLRYWEQIGLLPRANRTHTGYRIFTPEVNRYIDFILKAKSVGLFAFRDEKGYQSRPQWGESMPRSDAVA